jgi:hypothetical protein
MDSLQTHSNLVKGLQIIPLDDGRWAHAHNATIFLPMSGGAKVPGDLELNIVAENSLQEPTRKALFLQLGVTECEPSRIFPLIENQYRRQEMSLIQSLAHFKFLFWHSNKVPKELHVLASPALEQLDEFGSWIKPADKNTDWIYCTRSNDPFALSRLTDGKVPQELSGRIKLINPEYYDALEPCDRRHDLTGAEWLRQFFQLKQAPQLHFKGTTLMSAELRYIIKKQPQSLVEILKRGWNQDQLRHKWNQALGDAQVPILASTDLMSLRFTHVPLPNLQKSVVRLGLEQNSGF